MALAAFGLALITATVLLRLWLAQGLKKDGQSPGPAWRSLRHSSFLWTGVVLVVLSISRTAGFALVLSFLVVQLVFGVVLVVRGVRGFPEFWKRVRRIGDPDAWRGN